MMMNKRLVSLALLLAFTVTSAAPAYALRQTGLEENPEQRDQLAKALQDRNDPVGAVAATVTSGLSRFFQPALPAAGGMEEWKAIPPSELPADLWRDLGAYGVALVGVEYRVLSPPTKGDRKEALQPFAHDGADVAITASVNDGLGSVLFHGIGKDQPPERIEVHKITVDGNAVFMGYHSLIDYTLRHRDVALLIRGDEGEQDASIALRVGSIFFRGEVIKFKDLPTLRAELRRLRELRDDDAPNGVTIRGVIGDALEVTTNLVVGDQDSWGLVAVVDLPQDPESLEKIILIPDYLRRSGWLYRAPRPIPVDQLNPFTPPTEGFRLIGLADGIDPAQDAAGYAGWMARQGLVTLGGEHPALGPKRGTRPFLNAIRSDGGNLAEAYPGFDLYTPTDGTVAPAFFTAHGIEVNGRTYALDVRHGYNEAEIVQVLVKNAGPGVHYVHTDTSPKATKKATSLTKQTAHNYTADERSGASGFGLDAERLESFDTEGNSGYTGVVAMTSVNGVTERLAGGLADSIQGIQFIPDSSGYGGRIVTHTLVSARDGSSYIVRSTFRANDLPEAEEWIKLASRLPSPVPPPLEKPTGEVQTLGGLAGVVAPGNIGFVQGRAQQEVSRTFRYLLPKHLAKLMGDLGIGYHLTFLHPGQIGQAEEAEFYRTRGHFHSEPVAELVEIYGGRGEILLWETQPTDRALATRAILLSVSAGDIFFVPWGWGHMSLNRDPGQMLVFGTWLKQGVRLDYPDASLRGAPYFIGPKPAGNRGNSSYASVPDLALRVPNLEYMKPALEIPDDRSLWSVAITDEARFIRILKHLLVPSNPALRPGLLFTADAAGMEEAPVIGFLREFPAGSKEAGFSQRLISGQNQAKGQATQILKRGVDSILAEQAYRQAHGGQPQNPMYRGFDDAFGQLLRLSRGNMAVFADAFLRAAGRYDDATRQAFLQGVRRLAQDPGAPHNKPPVSYHNPARYVYAFLRQEALRGFVTDVLDDVVGTIRANASGVDLSDVEQKARLVQKLQKALDPEGKGRQTVGPYQYEIFYDSLVQKGGETYLTLELLLDGSKDYREGVVLELQVLIPAPEGPLQYRSPYPLPFPGVEYRLGLLDPIHFINARFPEWRPRAQQDIYESRIRALRETRGKVKRQYIRPSVRQGNNPRFYEPFFRAYLAGNVPLIYHIVDALGSERDYGNQGGVGSVGTLASAIVRRGGIGVTASWYLENPATARILARKGRTLVYAYEKDHHRIDNIKDAPGFASELEPFLLAYPENLVTGWPSSNLQDETKFISQKARDPWVKAGTNVAETGVIDGATFSQLQEIYNGTPVTPGLPSAFQLHWLRNRWLHHVVDQVRGQGVPLTPFDRWYIEPDYALDGKPHTVEEMAYLTFMSWVSAQAHGHPLGPVVPSYGNVHGASAGNPSLALAGIHQYAAQAATLFGEPLPEDLLAIARKAPRGSIAIATRASGHFQDVQLRQEFNQVVETAGERTEAEESRLRDFALAQLQRIPADVLKGLKRAEQVLLREVEQAQKEKRQPRPLAEVAPDVARELEILTRQLDEQIYALSLDRWAAITTHAASGLSAEQLSQAREYGVWVANKSTEFQNIITKPLEVVYLQAVAPERAYEELIRMPAAHSVWNSNPLNSEETERVADLYRRMWDAAALRAIKAAKTDADKDLIRNLASNPDRPFPWFWRESLGWSMESPTGADWSPYEWIPGAHGRYMFSMRDTMTGQGIDNTLLFPNALTWGLPPTVIQMAQAEIERTIHFYHQPEVMNAVGGAAEVGALAGMEEQAREATQQLDAPNLADRLAALRRLKELEQQGVKMPAVEPALPAAGWIHVHTDRSYPGVPGAYSPAHMVWAAHRQGANDLYLVDHETVAHIPEGFEAARIVNEGRATPLRVLFGVEFRTRVDSGSDALRDGLGRGVGRDSTAAWVVAMGVPITPEGQVPEALVRFVRVFQTAKLKRAETQINRLNKEFGLQLSLGDMPTADGRNVTERALAEAAAQALRNLGSSRDPAQIRDEHLRNVPYLKRYGFLAYNTVIEVISQLGMTPAFTMQVPAGELEGLLPELKKLGIGALDLSGIESKHPNAERDIQQVIALAERNGMPVVGGSDYRGTGAVGWPNHARWMEDPYLRDSLNQVLGAGMEEEPDEQAIARLAEQFRRTGDTGELPALTALRLVDELGKDPTVIFHVPQNTELFQGLPYLEARFVRMVAGKLSMDRLQKSLAESGSVPKPFPETVRLTRATDAELGEMSTAAPISGTLFKALIRVEFSPAGMEGGAVKSGVMAGRAGQSLPMTVYKTPGHIGRTQAEEVMRFWADAVRDSKPFVLGLGTGSTPMPLLNELVARLEPMGIIERQNYMDRLFIVVMDDIVDRDTGQNVKPTHEKSAQRFFEDHLIQPVIGHQPGWVERHLVIPRPGQVTAAAERVRKELGGVKWQFMATDPNEGHVAEVAAGERYRDTAIQAAKDRPREFSSLFLQHNSWARGYQGITFTLDDFVDMMAPDGVVRFAAFGGPKAQMVGQFFRDGAYEPERPITFLWLPGMAGRTRVQLDESAAAQLPAPPGPTTAGAADPLARPYLVRLSPDYAGPVAVVGKGGGTDVKFQAGVPQGLVEGTEVSGPTVINPATDTERDVLDRVAESAAQVIDRFGADRILYVYLSFPGYFDPNMVLTRDQENIAGKWKGLDIARELETRLARRYAGRRPEELGHIRVILVHDGTGHANGERSRFGRFPGAPTLFFIAPGTGIATRGIVNGQPFTGGPEVQYLANEAPHTLVRHPEADDYRLVIRQTHGDHPDFTSPTRADGQPNPLYGAEDLEDRASGPNVARYAMALARSGQFEGETAQALRAVSGEPDLKKIAPDRLDRAMKEIVGPAVQKGDPLALKAVRDRGRELGIGLAVLLVEFNRIWGEDFPIPPHVVVGGGVSQIGAAYFEAVKEGFRGRLQGYGLPDANALADRLFTSDIGVDSDRELLGGLPTESQVADHLARLGPPKTGMEESEAIREAEGEVRSLEIRIADAERGGDTGLAQILELERIRSADRLSRLRAEAAMPRWIPEDAEPKLVSDEGAGMEEVWVLPVEPIDAVAQAFLRLLEGRGSGAAGPADWVSFFAPEMRYRMQGIYLSQDADGLQGRLKRVAREGGEARYIRLAVENGILNVDPALSDKPKTASVWRAGALPEEPLKIIFRPENAGLAFFLPKEGVVPRIVVADLAQRTALSDLRPDLAGAFIQADESGGVEAALRQARQELGKGAIEVNLDLSHHPATLAAQIQSWLKRFPWKAPRLTDQVRDAVLAGTQA